jgi:hypothetical protein
MVVLVLLRGWLNGAKCFPLLPAHRDLLVVLVRIQSLLLSDNKLIAPDAVL